MLRVIRSSSRDFPLLGSVVTIGNFDGMHLGHQAILERICEKAKKLHVASVIILFEPQPQEFFHPQASPPRLMRLYEKISYLQNYPLDYVYCFHFQTKQAEMSANEFINKILVEQLAVRHLLVGNDFCFGYKRSGTLTTLQQAGLQNNFTVEVIPTIMKDSHRISSTLIRNLLTAGNLNLVCRYLDRPYSMIGRVIHGLHLGTVLGYPTANIAILRKTTPLLGVFVVQAYYYIDGQPKNILYKSIAEKNTAAAEEMQRGKGTFCERSVLNVHEQEKTTLNKDNERKQLAAAEEMQRGEGTFCERSVLNVHEQEKTTLNKDNERKQLAAAEEMQRGEGTFCERSVLNVHEQEKTTLNKDNERKQLAAAEEMQRGEGTFCERSVLNVHEHGKNTLNKAASPLLLQGVACIGYSPIFNRQKILLEIHFFDFNQTIYGEMLQVFFLQKLRDEQYYDDVKKLKQQIAVDVQQAKEFFKINSLIKISDE